MDDKKRKKLLYASKHGNLRADIKEELIDNGTVDSDRNSSDESYQSKTESILATLSQEAKKVFPSYSPKRDRDDLNQFVKVALADFSHTKTFKNASEIYGVKAGLQHLASRRNNWEQVERARKNANKVIEKYDTHPLSDYLSKLLPYFEDRSVFVLTAYTIALTVIAPIAGFVAFKLESNVELPNREAQHFTKTVVSLFMFWPLRFFGKKAKTVRRPTVASKYLPILVIVAVAIFLEYSFSYRYFAFRSLDFSLTLSNQIDLLINAAQEEWLYTAPLVVIVISLLQHTHFIGPLVPSSGHFEGMGPDNPEGWLRTAIVAVIAIAVSAVLKVLLSLFL